LHNFKAFKIAGLKSIKKDFKPKNGNLSSDEQEIPQRSEVTCIFSKKTNFPSEQFLEMEPESKITVIFKIFNLEPYAKMLRNPSPKELRI